MEDPISRDEPTLATPAPGATFRDHGVIFLPTRSGSQIELRLEDLNDCSTNDILTLLKEEGIPLSYWVTIGRALMQLPDSESRVHDLVQEGAEEALTPTLGDYSKRERMDIINMVATLYLTKFSKGNPKDDFDKKLEYLTTARSYFQKAEDQHLLVTSAAWIGRGSLDVAWFLLNKRADVTYLDCAFQYFETARELAKDATTPHEIQHAHIGLGLVCYLKKDWKNAAVQYQNVFRFGPGPPNILFSLALCHHKLGEDEKAQNIVLRILEQQPDHLGSLCAMAKGIVSPTPELSKRLGIPEATPDDKDPKLKWLTKAVEAHPGEPLASVLLCDDLISTSGSNSDMWDILTAALPRCMDRNLQSEIHYQLGRMCHEEGKIREAERHLRKCIDIFNGKHYSAMYTLAQVLGREGEIAEATTMLEDIREAHPNDYDVMKLLSVLYVEKEEYEQALECVNKCVLLQRDRGDDDINLWVLQARCLVAQLTKGDMYAEAAIKAYERLLEYVGQKPAESEQVDQCIIWNNIGTLKFKKKDLDGARHAYEKALEILDGRGNEADTTHLRATLVFNLACVHEEKSEFQNAADRYHSLLLQYPWFTEPKSRLGSLELRQRNPVQALTHLEASQSTSLTNVLLTSEAYRQQGQYEKARSVVAQALKERDTENSYKTVATTEALVYLGTLHYEMALLLCPYRRAPQRDQHFQRAFQLFTKAYEGHPEGQPLAANGMAMVFAQKKEFNKAHRLFSKVLQMNESPHVRMNLGHTYMRGGATKVNPGAAPNPLDARKALRLYEAAWNKNVFSDDAEKTHIATSMALAHFVAKDFAKGIEVLEQAKEANPGNQQIIYNLAISKHGQASKIMKNTEERAKPEKVKGAVELLKEAKIGFESVIDSFLQCKQSGSVPLGFEDLQKLEMKKVVGICRARQTHCGDSIDGCTEWLQRQADSVTQMAARQRREREKQLQLMREEEESIEAEKRKEQEEAEKKRREAEELAESLMEVALGMQLPRETDKEPERGEKKKKDDKSDGEEQEEGEDEGGEEAPKVDLTEEEKEERQRRKDEKRLAKMTEEERAAYIEQKEAKRKKRAEKEAKRQAEKKKKADAAEGVEGAGSDEGANGADAGEGAAAEGPAEDSGEVEKKKKKSKKDKKDKNKDKAEKKNKKRKLEKRAANDGGVESGPAAEAGAEGASLGQGDAAEDGEQAAKKARTEPVMAKEEVVDESKEDVLDDLFPDENEEEDDLFAETLGAADAMELEPTQPMNAEPSGFESTQPVGGYPSEFVPTQPMEVPTQPMEVPTQPMEAPTQPMGDVLMGFESTQPTGDASSEFVPTLPMSDDPMGFEPTQPTGDDPTEFVPTQPMDPSE